MKTSLTLKSLAALPAQALGLASAVPAFALDTSRQALGAGVRATRTEIRAARRRSAEFAQTLYARANAPFCVSPWQSGGLNE